jgi:hypothetical protein
VALGADATSVKQHCLTAGKRVTFAAHGSARII